MALHSTYKNNTAERKEFIITRVSEIILTLRKIRPEMGTNHLAIFFLIPLAKFREVKISCSHKLQHRISFHNLPSVPFFTWHLFGGMKSQSMTEHTEKIISGTLSNAENSHHLRWKSCIRTHIAAHSALLAASCCTPVLNLHCELWLTL